MNCKCGGATTSLTHKVTTLKMAKEWDDSVNKKDLPLTIYQDRCKACGRQEAKIVKS